MGDLLLSNPITLSEVWIAYRKAKFEAYKDKQCAQSFKFVKYEQEIANNLASAFDWLSQANHEAIGEIPESRCQTIPKSLVSNSVDSRQGHFAHYDNISTWKQRHKEKRAGASFRQIIDSPVNVQLLDTLWCMRTGEKLDRLLSNKTVFANRLRRRFYNLPSGSNQVEPLNLHAHAIFKSYVSQYGLWRQLGLDSTRSALEEGKTVVVFTLDISSYYNSIDIDFLDNESFLEHFPYEATAVDVALTESIANLIKDWRTKYLPDPNLGIPIGLRSSCIIANAYLAPFDNLLSEQLSPIFYGRYVDDIFLCLQVPDDISIKSPSQAKEWLCSQLSWLSLEEGRFKLTLPYAQDHPIYFGTEKERVFLLKDDYGITLIDTIKEHMSKQSSEFRLLPTLDDTEAELYDKVLLLSRDPSVLGANFREAEELTLRRSGLAEVLRRFEIVCGLLPDEATTAQRNILCKLLHQHLLTPQSLFDFYSYVPRFFNLMVKHGDVENIKQCLIRLKRLRTLIEKYTDSTPTDIERSFETLYRLIEQAMIQSAHAARNYKSVAELISLLPDSSSTTKSIGVRQLRDIATQFWLSDWSSTRVAESLQYIRGRRFDSSQVPMSVRQLYHFGEVSSFLQKSTFSRKLSSGNWRGLFFPTRPMRVDELSRAIPPEKLYTILPATETYHGFETSLFGMACTALCGRRIKPQLSPRTESAKNGPAVVRVGGARTRDTIVLLDLCRLSSILI